MNYACRRTVWFCPAKGADEIVVAIAGAEAVDPL